MTDDRPTAQEEAYLRGEPEAVAAMESPAPETPAEKPAEVKPEAVEKPAEAAPELDPDADEDRLVPHGALAEARAKARASRQELAKEREARARLEGRLEALLAGQKPADPDAPKPVSLDENPVKYFDEKTKTLEDRVKAFEEREALQQHVQALNQTLLGAESSFKAKSPDYDQAKIHARTSYFEELKAIGYDDETAFNTVVRREQQIVNNAIANGRDPAEVIYALSKTRGWTGAKPAPVAPTPADKVALAAKGQEGAKSLGAAPGGAAAELSVEALAGLNDEDFAAKFRGEKGEREFRRLFGG